MKFPPYSYPVTGLAVSVGSLKSKESCGIGEFLDLIPLVDFCKTANLDMVQLLPVNDTGTESSPYSALSAFALHPVYLRLQDIPEASKFTKAIADLKKKYETLPRFNYPEIRNAKLNLLHTIFEANQKKIMSDSSLAAWIDKNPWIVEYAVFMNLKRDNFDASWKAWEKMRTPSHTEIENCWKSSEKRSDHLFFAWVQMRLDEQFSQVVEHSQKKGIALKGDIPIMMNEDSCDAWANPEFFRDDLRAGSPPDDLNPTGQNWGFPIYNWENLRVDGYSWWKKRLAQTAKYYHAYRIDHILGFFRIWSIPYGEESGCLGWTTPHAPITDEELAVLGFTGDRLRWLCEPHVPTNLVESVNHLDYLGTLNILQKVMNRIGNEELWLFKPEIQHENDIRKLQIPEAIKNVLINEWRNRMMQITGRNEKGKNLYAPTWKFRETTAWKSLSREEREYMEHLIHEKNLINENLWKGQAKELLGTLTASVDMLACAEDLGTVPETVPEVLSQLGILGLKVIRWEKHWNEQGHPFKNIEHYPELSVATSSVHDSSTLRGWWESENGAEQFLSCWKPEEMGYPGGTSNLFKPRYSPEAAAFVLETLAKTSSKLLILPVQDILALSPDYSAGTAEEERINIPGSVTAFNWTYRLPTIIEELLKNTALISTLKDILKTRRTR